MSTPSDLADDAAKEANNNSPPPPAAATEILTDLERHLVAGDFTAAFGTLSAHTDTLLVANPSETFATIGRHLNDDNFQSRPATFVACERILCAIATTAPTPEDALFELLEIVETTRSDQVFTSTLKALQICLRRPSAHQVRSLEWALGSIVGYIVELPLPEHVRNNADGDAAELLFEDDPLVRRVLTNVLTLMLFYEPLAERTADAEDVRSEGGVVQMSRANVLASFLLHLLGRPLLYLNMQRPESKLTNTTNTTTCDRQSSGKRPRRPTATNTYSWQCGRTLCAHLLRTCPDPYAVLAHVERRSRWPPTQPPPTNAPDPASPAAKAQFSHSEQSPTLSVGVWFYLLYVERLMPAVGVPKVYSDLYLFECMLYVLADMLHTNDHAVHAKALRLTDAAMQRHLPTAADSRLPAASLGLRVHEDFCTQLCRIVTQSPSRQNSQHAAQMLRRYVLRFDAEGRWLVCLQLLRTQREHSGLLGHVACVYKDMLAEALRQHDVKRLPYWFEGDTFRMVLMQYICRLDVGAETDLLQCSDQLVTALNVVLFVALADAASNRTGFWDWSAVMVVGFLQPFRVGLEMTRLHYAMEEQRVAAQGEGEVGDAVADLLPIDKAAKLKMLRSASTTFDLMESLLTSVERAVRERKKT